MCGCDCDTNDDVMPGWNRDGECDDYLCCVIREDLCGLVYIASVPN